MWFLKPNIEKLRSKKDFPRLIRAVMHRDRAIARAAEKVLLSFGSAAADALEKAFLSTGPVVLTGRAGLGQSEQRKPQAKQEKILCLLCEAAPHTVAKMLSDNENALGYLCLRGYARGLSSHLHDEKMWDQDTVSCNLIAWYLNETH